MSDTRKEGGQIDLGTLNVQQISQLKKQLDEELEQLTTSFSHLNAAQTKFQECLKLVQAEPSTPTNGILVPLTNSLYVRGRLSDSNRVLVDIGTGFYIEKTLDSAIHFYEAKVSDLGSNLGDLENIVQGKSTTLRLVEEVLRQKMTASS